MFSTVNKCKILMTTCSSNIYIRTLTNGKTLTLYGDNASPPVRFVQMTASFLDIKMNFHKIDLFKGENKTDSYAKINPLQKVPALATENSVITDSHAIALYLCRQVPDQDLYPKDTLSRANVDQMLFLNAGSLFPLDRSVFTDYFAGKPLHDDKLEEWRQLLDYLELRLKNHQWIAGDKITLSDLCCGSTVSSLQLLVPPTDKHDNFKDWMRRLEQIPCFSMNKQGIARLSEFVEKLK